ncbi:MAG: hypothetical protein ABI315_14565 [Bacteroidia bacterium]
MNNRKIRIKITSYILGIILIFGIGACVKDNFQLDKLAKAEWNPNLAVPLVYSSLTIQDIINKDKSGLINVGNNQFCSLIYKGNLFSTTASDFIKIPDQQISYSASLDASQIIILANNATVTASYSQTVNFVSGASNAPKVDSIKFKAASMSISINSDFRYTGQILLTIPTAKKNGVVFSKLISLPYSGTLPVIATATFDISGYTFDMTIGGTTYNQFAINYDLTLMGSSTVPPTSLNKISITGAINNVKFDKVFGDIGQQSLTLNKDTIKVGVFKNSIAGAISLVDPKVKVTITNSYGVPINAVLDQFDAYTPGSPAYAVTGSPNPLPIFSPNFNQVGQSLESSFILNNTNSNIVDVIKNFPRSFIYKLNSQTNPAGPTHANFVLDSSRFKVDMEVQLPLWGTAKNFVLVDTVSFKMDSTVIDEAESVLLRTYNSNGFPIDLEIQVYFVDSTYKKLDSLVTPNQLILQSALVNTTTAQVISPTEKVYDAVFDSTKLQHLKKTKYLLITAKASTTSGGTKNIKIYSYYKLDVKLGLQIKVKKKI